MSAEGGSNAAARAEQARQTATALVHAVYRLVKSCALHSDTNQAVVKAATGATVLVAELAGRSDVDFVTMMFTPNAVFVNGKILKMTRETFALAAELGTMLEACEVNELSLAKDVPATDLARFARLVAEAQREKSLGVKLREATLEGVRVRKVKALGADGGRRDDSTPAGRAVKTFAQAVIIMREFYAALRAGDRTLPNRVKRIAQKLVAHAEDDARRLVTLAVATPSEPGHAGLAVSGTVLVIAMGRQLTTDRRVLGSLAQAALLYDAGRARLLGEGEGLAAERALSDGELDRTPASEVHVLTSIGRIHQPAMARNVIAYEALRVRRQDTLGLPYGGRRPTSLAAHLLASARAFVELRAYQPGTAGLGIDEAIQLLLGRAEDAQQRTVVKLLVGALGIFPAGTLVELSTGEQAVMLSTPALPVDFARPPVRILYDARARLLDEPLERDLAAPPSPGEPRRLIRRTVDADESQMKAMRAYVSSTASSRRRTDSRPLSADSQRRVYDQNASTDVMRHGRAGDDSGARMRGAYDALTPAPTSERDRRVPASSPRASSPNIPASQRLGSPVMPGSARLGSPGVPVSQRVSSPGLPPQRLGSPPSTQDPPSVPPRSAPGSLRDAGGSPPDPRTMPPIRFRPSARPAFEPAARGSDAGAPDAKGRLGTLEWSSTDDLGGFEELPELDTGLPVAEPPSSRTQRPAWGPAPSRSDPTPAPRTRDGGRESGGLRGGRSLSPAAGLRVPESPLIFETPTRAGPVDVAAPRREVEYEAGNTTREASWDEFRDLLDLGARAERSEEPPRRTPSMADRIAALDVADDGPPPSGRGARTSNVDVSEATRIGSGSVHDLLLAAYLADDSVDAPAPAPEPEPTPEPAPRAARPTPRATPVRSPTPARAPSPASIGGMRSVRAPMAPAHGLRWGGHDEPTPEPEPSSSSPSRTPTRPGGK